MRFALSDPITAAEEPKLRASGVLAWIGLAVVLFGETLRELAIHSAAHDLHSHVLLVPWISAFLIWRTWSEIPSPGRSAPVLAAFFVVLAGAFSLVPRIHPMSEGDRLSAMLVGFLCMIFSGGFLFLGTKWMKAAAFPLGFLFLMVPMPGFVVAGVEFVLVQLSSFSAGVLLSQLGIPFIKSGVVFHLPGISLEIAPECSGIRSTWVLFITSLLASFLFLRTRLCRLALVAVVIPIGILRNAIRIAVIALLCVESGPHMINSIFHRGGGPLFFLLSLLPFTAVVLVLWTLENRKSYA